MAKENGGLTSFVKNALRLAITIIILLISAWAVDVTRRIEAIAERQREVLIRLRAVEIQQRWPPDSDAR